MPTLLAEFKGHTKPVSSVAFNADGRFLVSGGGDLVVRVWDLSSKTELRALRGHVDWVSSVAFGPNGRTILSAGVDKTVKVWELSSEETAKPVGHYAAAEHDRGQRRRPVGRQRVRGPHDQGVGRGGRGRGVHPGRRGRRARRGRHLPRVRTDGQAAGVRRRRPQDHHLGPGNPQAASATMNVDQRIPVHSSGRPRGTSSSPGRARRRGDNETNNFKTYDPDGKPLNSLDLKDRKVLCTHVQRPTANWPPSASRTGRCSLWSLKNNERVGGDWAAFNKDLGDIAVTPGQEARSSRWTPSATSRCTTSRRRRCSRTFQAHTANLNGVMVGPGRHPLRDDLGQRRGEAVGDGDRRRSYGPGRCPTPVRNIAFSADGKKLITANGDTTLYVLTLP